MTTTSAEAPSDALGASVRDFVCQSNRLCAVSFAAP
jgi:hypothetical protein